MLIKFKKPDPRAGLTARMDSSRGQQLIDAGAADLVVENTAAPKKPLAVQAKVPEPQETDQEQNAQVGEAAAQADGDAATEAPATEGAAQADPEAAKPKSARGKK